VPKSNRGIFAMNELPDLSERIQVGLLNVLEERDVQIRGHLVRLELDVLVVATANPEDYTNRGRLITPLKDRFGSQIRTHYPYEISTEIEIMSPRGPAAGDAEANHRAVVHRRHRRAREPRRTQEPRHEPAVRACRCVSRSPTTRRWSPTRCVERCAHDDVAVVPRVSDLSAMVQSTQGKIEFDTMDDSDSDQVIAALVSLAVRQCFAEHVLLEEGPEIVEAFNDRGVVHTGDDLPDQTTSTCWPRCRRSTRRSTHRRTDAE
jgi:magnesium chelatase subunit I